MPKKIIFTGGGSAGHVTPNMALIEKCQGEGFAVEYIGSYKGIEKELISKLNIPYHKISSGKLRRYFSGQNFLDPLKIFWGGVQALFILLKSRPNIIFSKGGFVAFPVVVAAWLLRIPIIIHESDFYPGLANKLSFPFAKKICITFAETKNRIKYKDKIEITGTPIRPAFFEGDAEKAEKLCGFSGNGKKNLLVFGGGLGAKIINEAVSKSLTELVKDFNVIHLTGKGKVNNTSKNMGGYKQFEYLHEDLYDVMALADFVISRAGANALYELLTLKKPHLLIPLSKKASRGDQIDNANYFNKKGLSMVIPEEKLTQQSLLLAVKELESQGDKYREALQQYDCPMGTEGIITVIKKNIT